jgi:molecular chaperone GrpE
VAAQCLTSLNEQLARLSQWCSVDIDKAQAQAASERLKIRLHGRGRRRKEMEMKNGITPLDNIINGEISPRESVSVSRDELSGAVGNVQEELQRLQADFVNFRRRVSNIADQAANDRAAEILMLLLPVLDNFDRALAAETCDAAYAEGVSLTYRHLVGVLKSLGLEPLHTVGETFDPHVHEGITRVVTDEAADGTVLQEFRRGYVLKGILLRPAQVSVAASPGKD